MLVFINDREIGAFSNEAATVGEVVDALRVHVDPSEVMTAVEVDGEVFSAGHESRYARRLARNIDRLVIATSPPRELARAMQTEARAALGVIAAKTTRVIELFRSGDDRAANRLLAALLEELRLALVLDRQVVALDPSISGLPIGDVEELATPLLAAQKGRRWDELAALLSQQLLPWLERQASA